ncbi:phosphoesterase [Cavenderia fasciculata]|uniref:Phosphoesterase n=1 Tax=Cavenderia fasciculata TaxID=261658 RepID=F4Q456_CACFS|nr:phosphoesterase [Cavenderia fasciculata]EGG17758.1 phosphoesterase [Cavenderia fasciculata]|eukprot:XP_004356242.1 phosphoesterase [Cavenderia fasciculata]
MGVPQPIELQAQTGNFKYFTLKEEINLDESTEQLVKDVPQLSVWGWFPPVQNYLNKKIQKNSNNSDKIGLKKFENGGLDKTLGFRATTSDILETNSNSSVSDDDITLDGINKPGYQIEFPYQVSGGAEFDNVSSSTQKYQKSNDNTVYPYSPVYSDITFSILVGVVCIFSITFSFLVGPLVLVTSYVSLCLAPSNRWYLYSITACAIGLGLCIPSFFNATGQVVLGIDLHLWDTDLFRGDKTLMGWVFPLGQLGLFVQDSSWFGPSSFIGRLSTEIFQISYISYYIWGYFMEIYILYKLWRASLSSDLEERKTISLWDQRLKMFICSWISTYFVCFSINLMFPAESPRVFLQGYYDTKLVGFGFAGWIRGLIDQGATGSFGSFPSGHIATSWAVAFASYKIIPTYGYVSATAAFLITIATMYLRYHYFVDFLCAVPVAFVCVMYGGFYSLADIRNGISNIYHGIKNKISSKSKNDDIINTL